MAAAFKDHFSALADGYASIRPTYPAQVFAYLAGLAPDKRLAWDVGCGSGQASRGLADHFLRVVATDASAAQIARAPAQDGIVYAVAPAEAAPMVPDGAVDLILAAQAAHWFDLPAFYEEARRAAAPGAILALATYRPARVADPAVAAVASSFYDETVGPDWPPERRHVETGYADLPFPFAEIAAPAFTIERDWTRAALVAYAGTWSAVAAHRTRTGTDPLPAFDRALAAVWPDADGTRRIAWPIALRLARIG